MTFQMLSGQVQICDTSSVVTLLETLDQAYI